MDFNNLEVIKNEGFKGFQTIEYLRKNKSSIPQSQGVYLVLRFNSNIPDFLEIGTGGFFKGKNPNVSQEILKAKWIDESEVIYIGKATNLQKRLSQYFSFGDNKNIGHYGGRYIWQIKNSQLLIVCWKETTEDARTVEKDLIKRFFENHSSLPFANLVF